MKNKTHKNTKTVLTSSLDYRELADGYLAQKFNTLRNTKEEYSAKLKEVATKSLDDNIHFYIRRVNRICEQYLNSLLMDDAISSDFIDFLQIVNDNPGITAAMISRVTGHLDIKARTLSYDHERYGFIERTRINPKSYKRPLYITPKGKDFLKKIEPIMKDFRDKMNNILGDDRDTFVDILKRLRKRFGGEG